MERNPRLKFLLDRRVTIVQSWVGVGSMILSIED